MLVVLPLPLIPMKQMMNGFFSLIFDRTSMLGTVKRLSILPCKEEAITSSTLPLGTSLSTMLDLRSVFIFSITSTATLFSSNASSKSQNNSSNASAETFLVVIFSVIREKKPFDSSTFEGSTTVFGASAFGLAGAFTTGSGCSTLGSSFLPVNVSLRREKKPPLAGSGSTLTGSDSTLTCSTAIFSSTLTGSGATSIGAGS